MNIRKVQSAAQKAEEAWWRQSMANRPMSENDARSMYDILQGKERTSSQSEEKLST